jgi:hypothetical protein
LGVRRNQRVIAMATVIAGNASEIADAVVVDAAAIAVALAPLALS